MIFYYLRVMVIQEAIYFDCADHVGCALKDQNPYIEEMGVKVIALGVFSHL